MRILFLDFLLKDTSVRMKKNCILIIINWLELISVYNIYSFVKFANVHNKFVKEFSRIAHLPKTYIKVA